MNILLLTAGFFLVTFIIRTQTVSKQNSIQREGEGVGVTLKKNKKYVYVYFDIMNDFGIIKIETNTKISFLYFPFLALICYKVPLPFWDGGGGWGGSTFWQIFYFKMHPTYNRQTQVVDLRLWFPLQRLMPAVGHKCLAFFDGGRKKKLGFQNSWWQSPHM